MAKVKVAGIQMACVEEREKNLAKAVALGRMAAEHGARVICYQQLPSTPWFPRERAERHFALAEGEDGPTLAALRPLAAETGTTLCCPLFERAGDGRFYNAAVVVGPDGGVLGSRAGCGTEACRRFGTQNSLLGGHEYRSPIGSDDSGGQECLGGGDIAVTGGEVVGERTEERECRSRVL
jgi:hypothetical protein